MLEEMILRFGGHTLEFRFGEDAANLVEPSFKKPHVHSLIDTVVSECSFLELRKRECLKVVIHPSPPQEGVRLSLKYNYFHGLPPDKMHELLVTLHYAWRGQIDPKKYVVSHDAGVLITRDAAFDLLDKMFSNDPFYELHFSNCIGGNREITLDARHDSSYREIVVYSGKKNLSPKKLLVKSCELEPAELKSFSPTDINFDVRDPDYKPGKRTGFIFQSDEDLITAFRKIMKYVYIN